MRHPALSKKAHLTRYLPMQRIKQMTYSIIVPCYNEARNLPHSATKLLTFLDQALGDISFEVIFVCDGATDNTLSLLESIHHDKMRICAYEQNQGKGYAVRLGMMEAKGDIRLFTDCDLAYGTEAVVDMLTYLSDHPEADYCVASRKLHPQGYEGYSFMRKMVSRVYYLMIRTLTGLKLSDSQSGLKAFRSTVAEKVFPLCTINRFAFDLEVLMMADKMGFRSSELPARVISNEGSSISLADPFKMFRDLLKIRRTVKKLKFEKK